MAKPKILQRLDTLDTNVAGKQDQLTFDNTPTQNSDNPAKSGGIYTSIDNVSTAASNADKVFVATYDSTTSAQIEAAYSANKLVICKYNSRVFILTYRGSTTSHYFTNLYDSSSTNNTLSGYYIKCSSNTWSVNSTAVTYATLASPALTGTPTAPTATAGTNTTQIATTAFVTTAVSTKQNTLTFDDNPTSGSSNPVKSGGVYTQLGTKAPLASPALTGTPTAPTATAGTNTTQIATTAFVTTAVSNSDKVFRAVHGTTTSAQIEAAYQANKAIYCVYSDRVYWMTYRSSSTNHQFVSWYSSTRYSISCSSNTWSDSISSTSYAPLASPALTGTPTAPTATAGTNTTQIATTAFVTTAVSSASEIFKATYGTTTFAELQTAVDAGKLAIVKYEGSTTGEYLHAIFGAYTESNGSYTGCYFCGISKSNSTTYPPQVTKIKLTSADVWSTETYKVVTSDTKLEFSVVNGVLRVTY